MASTWKYMLFLVSALVAAYAYAPPNLGNITKPRWLDDMSGVIKKSLAVRARAEVSPVDPVAAANLDEDLDYRIAQRTKSFEGWRSFLTAHPNGPHAQSARAEVDELVGAATPPVQAAVQTPDPAAPQAPDHPPPDAKIPSEAVPPPLPSSGSEAATLASDEICRGDEERLEQLSSSLTSEGVIRLLIDLRCEKLRPQLVRLAERVDEKAPTAAADPAQGAPSSVLPEWVLSAPPLPPERMRENEAQNRTHPSLSSRDVQPKRRANAWAAPNLPELLLALFGEGPRNSAGVRRVRAAGGPGGGH